MTPMSERSEVKPLSLEGFAEFCESKPKRKKYEPISSWTCACAQYSEHLGMVIGEQLPKWRKAYYRGNKFWQSANDIACAGTHTFGALALRLREAANHG